MKNIEHLRLFFRISNATFDFVIKVNTAFGQMDIGFEMRELHKSALAEVEKDEPNMGIIDSLLEKMQELAMLQAEHGANKFPTGGTII